MTLSLPGSLRLPRAARAGSLLTLAALLSGPLACAGPVDDADAGDPRAVSYIEPVNPTGTVAGRVVDALTQAPLAGVEVTLLFTGGGDAFPTVNTDGNGAFEIANVPSSTDIALRFALGGYADAWTTVSIPNAAGNLAQDNGLGFAGPIGLLPTTGAVPARYRIYDGDGVEITDATAHVTLDVRFLDDGAPVGQISVTAAYDPAQGAYVTAGLPDLAALASTLPSTRVRATLVPGDTAWAPAVVDLPVSQTVGAGVIEVTLEPSVDPGPYDAGPPPWEDATPLGVPDSNVGDLIDGNRPAIPATLGPNDVVSVVLSRPLVESTLFVDGLDQLGDSVDVGAVTQIASTQQDQTTLLIAAPAGGWPAGEEIEMVLDGIAAATSAAGAPRLTRRGVFLTQPAAALTILADAEIVDGAGNPACPNQAAAIRVALSAPVGNRANNGNAAINVDQVLAIRALSDDARVPDNNPLSSNYLAPNVATAQIIRDRTASGYSRYLQIGWTGPFDNTVYPPGAYSIDITVTLRFNDTETSAAAGGFGTGVVRGPGGTPVGDLTAALLLHAENFNGTSCQ